MKIKKIDIFILFFGALIISGLLLSQEVGDTTVSNREYEKTAGK